MKPEELLRLVGFDLDLLPAKLLGVQVTAEPGNSVTAHVRVEWPGRTNGKLLRFKLSVTGRGNAWSE